MPGTGRAIVRDWLVMQTAGRWLAALVGAAALGVAAPLPASAVSAPVPAVEVLGEQEGAVPTTAAPTSVVTEIDDPESTRTVNRIIVALLVLGGVLLVLTAWFFVATKPLHPALEGLELMSSRRWATADAARRDRQLAKLHARRGPIDERLATVADRRYDPAGR
jgi:hypothetical protein